MPNDLGGDFLVGCISQITDVWLVIFIALVAYVWYNRDILNLLMLSIEPFRKRRTMI